MCMEIYVYVYVCGGQRVLYLNFRYEAHTAAMISELQCLMSAVINQCQLHVSGHSVIAS